MLNSTSGDYENTCESLNEDVSLDESSDGDDETGIPKTRRLRICSESGESIVFDDIDTDRFVQLSSDIKLSNETNNTFFEIPGSKLLPDNIQKPIAYFELFFTPLLIKTIVKETNRYAQRFLNSGKEIKHKSRVKSWKPVTGIEMKAFIAVLLEMGITKRPTLYSYWSNDSRSIPWFKRMFSRDRFQLILKFFRIVDNTRIPPHPDYGSSSRFAPLIDHADTVFQHYYQPHGELSTDESLVDVKSTSFENVCFKKLVTEVDESDKMLYVYLNERKPLKFWKKMTFHIFGKMVLGSYILYSQNTKEKKLSRLRFTGQIIESIEKEWLNIKNAPDTPVRINFGLEKLSGTKLRRCVVCCNKGGKGVTRSSLICVRCKKGVHGICVGKHFCQ